MKRFAYIVLPLLLLSSLARAEIAPELLARAEKGDGQAQLELAMKYMSGDGVAADEKRAVEWLQKAALAGNHEAIYSLGMLYRKGQFVRRDNVEALKWLTMAAKMGDTYAQYALADMYSSGDGVMQRVGEAVKWWIEAAEGGHPDAQLKAGTAYLEGRGVEKDDAKAYFWLGFPSQGDNYPGEAQLLRDRAAKHLKEEKIKSIDRDVQNWVARDYRKDLDKAKKGDAAAQVVIATLYLHGAGAVKNVKTAEEWFAKAAKSGNAEAQFHLGEMLSVYKRGEYKAAAELFEKAAGQNHEGAIARLGDFSAEGIHFMQSDAQAATLYRKAADFGSPHAMSRLGVFYFEGRGVAKDYAEALFWLSLAAGLGHDKEKEKRESSGNALSPEQRAAVKQRLKDWRATPKEQGDLESPKK